MLIDNCSDEERQCALCGKEGVMYELELWHHIEADDCHITNCWWLCSKHQRAMNVMICRFFEEMQNPKLARLRREVNDFWSSENMDTLMSSLDEEERKKMT